MDPAIPHQHVGPMPHHQMINPNPAMPAPQHYVALPHPPPGAPNMPQQPYDPAGVLPGSHPATAPQPIPMYMISAVKYPPGLPWPDISGKAKWSVSSYKFGFGVECLRDGDPDTFWHSDGPQPHYVTIEFPRKVAVQKLSIYLTHPQDDSYTPSTLAIRAGTGVSDLQDIRLLTLDKPDGWITFDISSESNEEGDAIKPLYAYVVQVIIAANHMSGKDTHVRGLRVLGPIEESTREGRIEDDPDPFVFASREYRQWETIR